MLGSPPKVLAEPSGVGDERGGFVLGRPCHDRERPAGHGLGGGQDVFDADSDSCADVEYLVLRGVGGVQGEEECVGDVRDVGELADSGAVAVRPRSAVRGRRPRRALWG